MPNPAPSSPPSAPSGREGRRTARRRMLKAGKIVSMSKDSVFDCMVRNVSKTGALLVVPLVIGVPEEFYLMLPPNERLIPCRMAWKRANRIGAKFLADPGEIRAN